MPGLAHRTTSLCKSRQNHLRFKHLQRIAYHVGHAFGRRIRRLSEGTTLLGLVASSSALPFFAFRISPAVRFWGESGGFLHHHWMRRLATSTLPHPTHSTPLRSAPLRSTPLRSTPLDSTLLVSPSVWSTAHHTAPHHTTPAHTTPHRTTSIPHSTPCCLLNLHMAPLHSVPHPLLPGCLLPDCPFIRMEHTYLVKGPRIHLVYGAKRVPKPAGYKTPAVLGRAQTRQCVRYEPGNVPNVTTRSVCRWEAGRI